jgi:Amt family ammonium transporter
MAQPISNLTDQILFKPIDIEQLQTLSELLASIHQPKARQFYFRDLVTELFNREFFLIRLEHAFERAKRREDFLFAVLVFAVPIRAQEGEPLDLDVHDRVLSQVCGRLYVTFRPTDTFARLEAERFAGLHEELKRPEDVEVLVKRLCQLVAEPVSVGERSFCPQARVGSTLFDRRYSRPEEMLNAAETALARLVATAE